MRAITCLILVAAIAAGCGGEDESAQPATDADTVGLPQEERNYISCLREAGIKVRVPAAVRRLARKGEYEKLTPNGVEGRFNLFFYMFDKRQRLTKEELDAAKDCNPERARETVDELGTAEPVIERLPKGERIDTVRRDDFTGARQDTYDQAKRRCAAYSRSANAVQDARSRVEFAAKHAERYRRGFQAAAFAGCLAGLK